jgi:uncharacterized protein YecE (DUF72 family)
MHELTVCGSAAFLDRLFSTVRERGPLPHIRIGTSGWTYPHWRKDFYPDGLRQRDELGYLAGKLAAVEINGSFYSLQRPSSYLRWSEETPEDFEFAVKGGRYLTHLKKLTDVSTPLATFLASGLLSLGSKLGPILWQLPAVLQFDSERIESFLQLLPGSHGAAAELAGHCDRTKFDRWDQQPALTPVDPERPLRHAIEVRHPSYIDDGFAELCGTYGVAIVLADTAGRWPWIDRPVTDFGYFRLHGSRELYTSGYTDAELDEWAERIDGWLRVDGMQDIWIFFDNDAQAHAAWDARRLAERLGVATER